MIKELLMLLKLACFGVGVFVFPRLGLPFGLAEAPTTGYAGYGGGVGGWWKKVGSVVLEGCLVRYWVEYGVGYWTG